VGPVSVVLAQIENLQRRQLLNLARERACQADAAQLELGHPALRISREPCQSPRSASAAQAPCCSQPALPVLLNKDSSASLSDALLQKQEQRRSVLRAQRLLIDQRLITSVANSCIVKHHGNSRRALGLG
jgi:hypothetical protein